MELVSDSALLVVVLLPTAADPDPETEVEDADVEDPEDPEHRAMALNLPGQSVTTPYYSHRAIGNQWVCSILRHKSETRPFTRLLLA